MIAESVSTHHVVGVVYPVHFREIDETGQFWKKMAMHTFIFKSEKICLKVPEDCVTLFIFLNAWGGTCQINTNTKTFSFLSVINLHTTFCVCLCPQTVTSQKFLPCTSQFYSLWGFSGAYPLQMT
jgi:hypothetical protein